LTIDNEVEQEGEEEAEQGGDTRFM